MFVGMPVNSATHPTMNDPDPDDSSQWSDLAEVGKYPTLADAHERSLVILAMREPCWVEDQRPTGEYALHATTEAAPKIGVELEAYETEQAQLKPVDAPQVELFHHGPGWRVYLLWACLLTAAFVLQGRFPELTERGASSNLGLIARYEWWRPFTALFLHADTPHLLGNLLSGMIFGTLVSRCIGAWLGWALILVCGTLGNLITSIVTWPDPFVSIGASTAVFGGLGMLAGLGFSNLLKNRVRLPWARTAAPVLAGIVLLGWLGGGAEGGNTDVLGHVFGFGSGVAMGFSIGHFSPATEGPSSGGTSKAAHGARI
jgi:membrane associated rhomboid family serine protease